MFERFGELESAKEVNELAVNLFNEGDVESLRVMADRKRNSGDFRGFVLRGRNSGTVRSNDGRTGQN